MKLGRRPIDAKKEQAIAAALKAGDKGIKRIAKDLGVGVGTVQRVKAQVPTLFSVFRLPT